MMEVLLSVLYHPILKTDEDICEQGQGWKKGNDVEAAGIKVMLMLPGYMALTESIHQEAGKYR